MVFSLFMYMYVCIPSCDNKAFGKDVYKNSKVTSRQTQTKVSVFFKKKDFLSYVVLVSLICLELWAHICDVNTHTPFDIQSYIQTHLTDVSKPIRRE